MTKLELEVIGINIPWLDKAEANICQKLNVIQAMRDTLLAATPVTTESTAVTITQAKPKRRMSAAGRARIAAAQRARWTKVKAAKQADFDKAVTRAEAKISAGLKRHISPEGKARIIAATKRRWAKYHRQQKKAGRG